MLAASTAKTLQRVAGDIVAARNRDVLMALAMLATAICSAPAATPSGVVGWPVARLMRAASSANFTATTSASSG